MIDMMKTEWTSHKNQAIWNENYASMKKRTANTDISKSAKCWENVLFSEIEAVKLGNEYKM